MNVTLIGNSFKYETEAVLKLFYPVISFCFYESSDGSKAQPDAEDGNIVIKRREASDAAFLEVNADIGGKSARREESVNKSEPDYEHSCELALCRLLFECMRELTGISPEWGILTGVRPVKLVARLKNSGMSDEEISEYLGKRCFVTEKKVRLACETAKNQAEAIKGLPKNSVSLYVSIPFCPSRCAYCSFVSQTVESFHRLIPEYADMLCKELERTAGLINGLGLRLDTVYFGGGTPTSLDAVLLDKLMKKISECFDLSHLREYTVEAGRPDTVTAEKLRVIRDNGGDRVSVNPQTLNRAVLEAIGRKHTVEQFFEAYDIARRTGFKAINVDLIAGLPSDTPKSFSDTLERIISLDPENITVHALSIKRSADMMHSREYEVSAEAASEMIRFSCDALSESGYKPYYLYRQKNQLGNHENVGWEKGGAVGIYNVNMMEEIQTVLACGAGGSTKIVAGQNNIRRLYNPKYPLEYLRDFSDKVIGRKDDAERMIREMIGPCGELGAGARHE